MTEEPEKSLPEVVEADGRYPMEAFAFLRDGLERAVREVYGEGAEGGEAGKRHVTGRQLCIAMRDEARDRWGMLARMVLRRWNIDATLDFGNMVYLLVSNGLMHKTDEDSLEDFRDVFDFEEAFGAREIFEAQQ